MNKPIRVLCIDDNPRDIELVRKVLEKESGRFTVSSAITRNEIKMMLDKGEFDVILTDYFLPEITGLEVFDAVKARNPCIPVIITTGTGSEEIAVEAMKRGVADYVIKSTHYIQCLPLTIQTVLERQKLKSNSERIQEQLKESEQRYRQLFDSNPHPMWVYDLETLRFLEVNDAAIAHYGYSRDEFLSMTIKDIRPQEDVPRLLDNVSRVTQGYDDAGIWRHRKKDGTIINVEITSHTLKYKGRPAELILSHDVTKRIQMEEALFESEEKYRLYFEADLAGVFTSTVEGEITICNPAFAKMFGYDTSEEVMKMRAIDLYKSPQQREEFLALLREKKRLEYYEIELVRRDGKPVYVVENVIGKFDENGDLTGITGYIFDDTKRRLLEQQFIQSQKIESLGTLAGGIAHDFNNILAIILATSQSLRRKRDDSDEFEKHLNRIERSVDRGAKLVSQILTFARKATLSLQPVDINALLEDISKMMVGTFPKTISIVLQLEPSLKPIQADLTQLQQVFMNLCVNSRDAMLLGGKLMLSTNIFKGSQLPDKFLANSDIQFIKVDVQDTGVGIEKDFLEYIFEPFFTTKGPGSGTGLGLSVAFGIIASHNGYVDVESEVGVGTTFHIYLPYEPVEELKQKESAQLIADELMGKGETILVIEDEPLLRDIVKNFLSEFGYNVITATDGADGVSVYAQNKEQIHIVLSDVGLPQFDGVTVFKKIRSLNSEAKIILASGLFDPSKRLEAAVIGAKYFVQKPYNLNEVIKLIRQMLDGGK